MKTSVAPGASRIARTIAVVAGLFAATAACQLSRDWLPRTHTASTSPDGRYTAFVRQGLSIDPPDDHLYLGATGTAPRLLMSLAPDADWCRTIVWTADSRRVGFLVRDQQLAVFDTATAEHVAMLSLVKADGYPGSQGARDIVLGAGGRVSFERFERAGNRSLGRETAAIPTERLSLRVTWDDAGTPVKDAWVRVRLADGNTVSIRISPAADGSVRLPSIEVTVPGAAGTATLRDVRITRNPLEVGLSGQGG